MKLEAGGRKQSYARDFCGGMGADDACETVPVCDGDFCVAEGGGVVDEFFGVGSAAEEAEVGCAFEFGVFHDQNDLSKKSMNKPVG